MAEGAPLNDQIVKLLQETRRTAYEAGYRDAVRDQAAARAISAVPAAAIVEPQTAAPSAAVEPADANRPAAARAPWGTTSKAAGIALDRADARGVTISEVCAIARDELGHEVAESSVRSILHDMAKRKQIKRGRNGRWHRISRPPETGTANSGGNEWNHPDAAPQQPRVIDLLPGLPEGRAIREEPETPARMVG